MRAPTITYFVIRFVSSLGLLIRLREAATGQLHSVQRTPTINVGASTNLGGGFILHPIFYFSRCLLIPTFVTLFFLFRFLLESFIVFRRIARSRWGFNL